MRNSIRQQLPLLISSLILLALTITIVGSYLLISDAYKEKMKESNSLMAASVASNIEQTMQLGSVAGLSALTMGIGQGAGKKEEKQPADKDTSQ